jgi:phenylpropionate dioxygenase-like ring-hydroxylating dioxygenase large terminal subunit
MDRSLAQVAVGSAPQGARTRPASFPQLPRKAYYSQEWFERELELLFGRQWLYAGHVSELPKVGDFLIREVGPESIVISRAEDGLHALFNTCRHRGARICHEPRGSVKRFICPYHRWSYAPDGRLLGAPRMDAVVDLASHPLIEGHLATWEGLIFINLSPREPESLQEMLAPALGGFEPLELARAKVAHEIAYDVRANWKFVLENYFECYHCPGSHPQLCRVFDVNANPSGSLDATGNPLVQFGSLALKDGARSLTITGETVSGRLLGRLTDQDLPVSEGLTLRPTTGGLFWGDYGVVLDFQPLSVDRTRMRCQWLVAGDAQEGRDYDLPELIALWDTTNSQDTFLCEILQQGVASRRFQPGPNSYDREPGVRDFRLTYLAMMDVADEGDGAAGP